MNNTSRVTWTFQGRNFTVVCTEEEQSFIDPLVHDQTVIDAINLGNCMITRQRASVYWRSVEVGAADLSDCVFDFYNDGYTIIEDHSYRYKVARAAISAARENLGDFGRDLPDL
jgi:hypothetical protein